MIDELPDTLEEMQQPAASGEGSQLQRDYVMQLDFESSVEFVEDAPND